MGYGLDCGLQVGAWLRWKVAVKKKAARTVYCSCREASDATCFGGAPGCQRTAEDGSSGDSLCPTEYQIRSDLCAELACHGGVAGGDAAGVVRDESELDAVVADVDVGMMVVLLSELSDAIDEDHCLHEIGEGPVADERAVFDGPLGEFGEECAEFVFGEQMLGGWHVVGLPGEETKA
jgi:hypothetical protein